MIPGKKNNDTIKKGICVFITLFFFSVFLPAQESADIQFTQEEFIISNIDLNKVTIKVYKGHLYAGELSKVASIIGSISTVGNTISFIPFVPFTPGFEYTLVINNIVSYHEIPVPVDYDYLQVENFYPGSDTLPENLLKCYVQFSKPVSDINIYDYLLILDSMDIAVDRVILNLENALLSDDRKMLTIWIEPGRQKRGLGPNKRLGSPFQPGMKYQVVISAELKDENGISMKNNWKKVFATREADREIPKIEKWSHSTPAVGSLDLLHVFVKEELDYGSTISGLRIVNPDGHEIAGIWTVGSIGNEFCFTPQNTWNRGNYTLIIKSSVEDLAGNNLNRLFDDKVKSNPEGNSTKQDAQIKIRIE